MKTLALVVILVYISFCSAATNRSTVWLLADELVYSTSKGYQACSNRVGSATNTSLITTSYFRITTGTAADVKYQIGSATASATGTGTTYILNTLQLIFTYGDSTTPNVVFNLPAFTSLGGSIAAGSYFNYITNAIPSGTYTSASGATWLGVKVVATTNYPSTGTPVTAAATPTLSAAMVLITDYRSSSTIAVMQYQDCEDKTGAFYCNHLYSVIVRTPTSLITSSTDVFAVGCTASRAAITSANYASQVLTSPNYPTCATTVSGAYDTSLSTSSACTDSGMPDAVYLSVSAMNALRTQDNTQFSDAGTKFTIAVNSAVIAAMSIVLFGFIQ